jgi:hypothetical protein
MNFIFFVFLISIILFLILACISIYKEKKQSIIEELEGDKNRIIGFEELSECLSEWLNLLEIPQLENKKKRLKISRRLSIVLIEKLTLLRIPHCISNTFEKEELTFLNSLRQNQCKT